MIKKSNRRQIIFMMIWLLYSVTTAFEFINYNNFINMDIYGVLSSNMQLALLAVYFIYNRKIKFRSLIVVISYALIVACIFLKNTDRLIVVNLMFIICALDIDFDKFIKIDLRIKSTIMITIILLNLIGVLDNHAIFYYGNTLKNSFGYSHPNTFTGNAVLLLIELMCVYYKKITKLKSIFFLLIPGIVIFYFGGGRTVSYTFFICYILFLISKINKLSKLFEITHIKTGIVLMPFIICAFSFFSAYMFRMNNSFFTTLNKYLSRRLYYSDYAIRNYGITLFGNEIEYVGVYETEQMNGTYMIIDNAYVKCGVQYGIIFLLLFCLSSSILLYKFLNKKKTEYVIGILYFIIVGYTEAVTLVVFYNIFMLNIVGVISDCFLKKVSFDISKIDIKKIS